MGEQPEPTKTQQDIELAKAQRSMGGRVDPDPTPTPEDTPPADPQPEVKKDITPEPPKDPTPPEPTPDVPETPAENKIPTNRPDRYIPLAKYHGEKKEWETSMSQKDTELAEAKKKIEELTNLSNQGEGVKKDEDIEAYMAKTGFDRETVEGLLELAEKRLLNPERVAALNTAESIVKEAQIEEAFAKEFTTYGEPELKKHFPNITAEQLTGAKALLDQVAHTKDFKDKTLDFIIFKHLDELGKLVTPAPADDGAGDPPPQDKKTIEGSRIGAGKPTSLTAKDFEGQADFSMLGDMEPAERSKLISDFSVATYQKFQQWVKTQSPGVEVMRNGQKVMLK